MACGRGVLMDGMFDLLCVDECGIRSIFDWFSGGREGGLLGFVA